MKKKGFAAAILFLQIFLTGCSTIGTKEADLSVVYAVTAVLSLLLLAGYCGLIRKKDVWFLLLFSSVFIVNAGYFALAVSHTLEEALLANRISYLGSIFLPLSMLMIIMEVCGVKCRKWVHALLFLISAAVFLVAASPGYLTIYYESVTLETIGGATVLNKTYGPWHCLYLYYLLSYFSAMVLIILRAVLKKKIVSASHAMILAGAVFVNIGVWLLEQLVQINFEILSVSYIITELFLLCLYLMMQEQIAGTGSAKSISPANIPPASSGCGQGSDEETGPSNADPSGADASDVVADSSDADASEELLRRRQQEFLLLVRSLTPAELAIYNAYLSGKGTKEIMKEQNIKENTLKYHNKNIYSKLGISSRKQLLETAAELKLLQ